MDDVGKLRLLESLKKHGFSEFIVKAFEKVPRENFVPEHWKEHAYDDIPLDIGYGQTISQPYTIAFMLSLLELKDNQKILEIGSGSGYVLALINELSPDSKIYGIERLGALALKSQKVLKDKENIMIFKKDGYDGLKKYSPYDRILISASAEELPKHLLAQLVDGGIMVVPVKNSIFHVRKTPHGFIKREFPGFIFVPLIKED
ncbi:MAG: protein-L-isoaspartate O-methyltransferase [Candidatus Pacearchaeota archaeon]